MSPPVGPKVFLSYQLRTTDVSAARAFYARVFGSDDRTIAALPEPARSRGARPHWLGYIGVPDVDATAAAFVARGAVPLGAKWQSPQGQLATVLRDPGGAVMALIQAPAEMPSPSRVAFHILNTKLLDHTRAAYAELLGWSFASVQEVAGRRVLPFAYEAGAPLVGAFVDVERSPEVHAHWLFAFPTEDLEASLGTVRQAGASALRPFVLTDGAELGVCDDAQGGAFALLAQTSKSSST